MSLIAMRSPRARAAASSSRRRASHRRVHDPVECRQRLGIGQHPPAQRRAVERAPGQEDVGAEPGRDRRENRLPGA